MINVSIIHDDITNRETEAIVNPANKNLILGDGVAGAIRSKGGNIIQQKCNELSPIKIGQAVITPAGNLPQKFVIHAVGPRAGEGNREVLLRNSVLNSLKISEKNKIKSISFPAISTGIFGYPMKEAANVILGSINNYRTKNKKSCLKLIEVVLYDKNSYNIFKKIWKDIKN